MGEKVIVLHPVLAHPKSGDKGQQERKFIRHPEAALEEARGLALAIDLSVVHAEIIKLQRITSATLIGSGSVERIKTVIEEKEAGLVYVDDSLSPIQQRNLEKAWNCKVIDRTGLILEIFGARARTREGQLQVELAAVQFQRSRLVKSWTHLERQRGGTGTVGGPGETQIELDRRLIDDRLKRLKAEIEDVRKHRKIQRESRKKEPYPIVALVGYTNAGKSTLFNHITGAKVFAKDLLFATLDTTMRGIEMPSGKKAILSDTVGFISDLPTHLVASFRATLEEVLEASVILHVRDISGDNTEAEKEDVLLILKDLGIDTATDERIIEVLNKIDRLPEDQQAYHLNKTARQEKIAAISALTGQGVDDLLVKVDTLLNKNQKIVTLDIDITDGKAIAWLYRQGTVMEREDSEAHARLKVGLDPADYDRFVSQYPYKAVEKRKKKK